VNSRDRYDLSRTDLSDALELLIHQGLNSGLDLFLRTAFGNYTVRNTAFIPVLGHIQTTVTAPVFLDIRFGVHAGAQDILVQIIDSLRPGGMDKRRIRSDPCL